MCWPRMTIWPSSGWSRPAIRRMVVVLPHPLGPMTERNSPRNTSRSTVSTAVTLPKRFETPWS